MKFNKILLPLLVLIVTFLICTYLYPLLGNFESDIIVNASSNNNVVLTNQIYARDLNNTTTIYNNTNSTVGYNDVQGSDSSWIIAVSFILFIVLT